MQEMKMTKEKHFTRYPKKYLPDLRVKNGQSGTKGKPFFVLSESVEEQWNHGYFFLKGAHVHLHSFLWFLVVRERKDG